MIAASIRPEVLSDRERVHALNRAAFPTRAEADLVDALRERASPVISLVADLAGATGGEIVGHIMFSPVTLDPEAQLRLMGLAPMAVAEAHRSRGIGSSLVEAGLDACRAIGTDAVVVLGHAHYYPRFGFAPAGAHGIRCEYDVPLDAFMVLELRAGALARAFGTVRYHAAFASV